MEHQKIINLLENTTTQLSKFSSRKMFWNNNHVESIVPVVKSNLRLQC